MHEIFNYTKLLKSLHYILFEGEESKAIPGYEYLYIATTFGRIYSFYNKTWLKPVTTAKGYLQVSLCKDKQKFSALVHQLILLTFKGEPQLGEQVRHFPNRNKTNNRLTNLSYGTPKQNAVDRDFHDTTAKGENNGYSWYTEEEIIEMREKDASGKYTLKELSENYGGHISTISQILQRKRWKHI